MLAKFGLGNRSRVPGICPHFYTFPIFRLKLTKFYYCFRFFAAGMYDTSYSDMQHLGAGHIFFVLTRDSSNPVP